MPYETGKILIYIFCAVALTLVAGSIHYESIAIELAINTLLIGAFIFVLQKKENAVSIFVNERRNKQK